MGKRSFADQDSPDAATDTVAESLPVAEVPAVAPELPIAKLAAKHGQLRDLKISGSGDPPHTPEHLYASVINGWNAYELKMGVEATLSDAAYLAAIEAAKLGKAHDAAKKEGV